MSPNRKIIDTFGRKRKRGYVKVFRETVGNRSLIRVQWSEPDVGIKTESFDDTRAGIASAKAFGLGVYERLTSKVAPTIAPITVRELYEKYVTAKETEWSHNTLRLSNERWGKFELFVGRSKVAHDVTRETLDELKKALLQRHSPNQVRHILKTVTTVYLWGVDRDLVPPTKVTNYQIKFRRSALATAPKMAEYTEEERLAIIAALDPRSKKEWRAWVANTILAYCGPRADATLQLEIDDIDIDETSGQIRWRPETDKMGTERLQPMPAPVVDALWVALGWRQYDRYEGRFIFYGAQRRTRGAPLRRHDQRHAKARTTLEGVTVNEKPWSYQALNAAIHRAEKRAGIAHVKYRAAHGHRRGVAGDVHAATGSEKKAADWIGDKSVRVVRDRYLLERAEEQKGTAQLIGGKRNQPQQPASEPSTPKSEVATNQPLTGEPAVGIEPTTARLQADRKWPKE